MGNRKFDAPVRFGMEIDQHAALYKIDGKILRAIKPKSLNFYSKIVNDLTIKRLIASNLLIETCRSSHKIDGYDLVLEHPLLDRVSYPFEWTPNMFRDAAITLLKLNINLMENGYCTHDAHLWNVLFDGITPKFVDFTSISEMHSGEKWGAYDQFVNCCLSPLLLMQAGHPTSARQLMREILSHPDPEFVAKILNSGTDNLSTYQTSFYCTKALVMKIARKLPKNIKKLIRIFINSVNSITPSRIEPPKGSLSDVHELLRIVESLNLSPKNAQWSEYYGGKNELPIYNGQLEALKIIASSTPKHALVSSLIERIKPVSVLDLGCNRGLYSQMAALQGASVLGVDLDERALDDMYLDSKRLGTSATPLYINAVAPAEATGFSEKPFPLVKQRLRSELVMCLALVHHLVFKGTNMSFEHIAKLLDSYSEKYLLIEFVPIEDIHIKSWYTDHYDWYNIDNLIRSLRSHFKSIEVHESFPIPRKLLFCSK